MQDRPQYSENDEEIEEDIEDQMDIQ